MSKFAVMEMNQCIDYDTLSDDMYMAYEKYTKNKSLISRSFAGVCVVDGNGIYGDPMLYPPVTQLSREEAIKLHESKALEKRSKIEIAAFQLLQDKLCVPFSIFHEAVEHSVGHGVFTHEFAYPENIKKEMLAVNGNDIFWKIIINW